jgi:hypothetical protein
MSKESFKPVTMADLGLSSDEIADLVTGAQKYLPPQTEDGEPINTDTSKDHANRP